MPQFQGPGEANTGSGCFGSQMQSTSSAAIRLAGIEDELVLAHWHACVELKLLVTPVMSFNMFFFFFFFFFNILVLFALIHLCDMLS